MLKPALPWLLSLIPLWACVPGEAGPCPADACGTLVIASLAEPSTLNPALAGDIEARDVHDLIFEKLADLGPDMNTLGDTGFVPKLAQSWHRENDRTLVFTLRPNARWHDGQPVRAADVAFSYRALTDPAVNSPHRASLDPIAGIVARDSLTIAVTFTNSYGAQLYDAVYHLRVLPEHLLADIPGQEWETAAFSRAPVGSGPYRFVQWDAGERIIVERNPDYWGEAPHLQRIVYLPLGSHEPIVNALLAQEADAVNALMPGPFHERLAAGPHLRAHTITPPIYGFIAFNMHAPGARTRPHPILADVRVRRALVAAVDRAAVVDAVLGSQGRAGRGPLTGAHWLWNDDQPEISYDTAAARALLREAGWIDSNGDGVRDRGGQPLRIPITATTSPLQHQLGVLVADAWRRVGVEAELVEAEPATIGARKRRGEFDAVFDSWLHDLEPYAAVRQRWTSAGLGAANVSSYVNAEYEALIEAAHREPDPARAIALWRQSLGVIVEDAPALFLFDFAPEVWIHRRFVDTALRSDSWLALIGRWRIDPAEALGRDLPTP